MAKRRTGHARRKAVATPRPKKITFRGIVDTLLPADEPQSPTWKYLPLVLVLAFAARAAIALWGDFVLHPDEIMQYLEPAHYAAFGNGVLYWEYLHGARSWLIPGAVASVLKALDGLGLGQPAIYIPAVKLLFCLLSLLVPWAMYRFTRITVNEQAARLALIFGCFWYELVALAHKPFTEFVGTALFMTAIALSVGGKAQRNSHLFTVGLLAALSGAIRLQYAPLALLLMLLRSLQLRGLVSGLASLWGGALLLTVLVGILEWQTWGAPFHSYLTNFFVNIALDASRTGESSRWLLLGQLTAASGGAAVIAFATAIHRRHALILLLSAVTLIAHLLPEHREYRFIYLLIPCWLMLLASSLSRFGDGSHKASALMRRYGAIAVLAFGLPAMLNIFPWQHWVYQSFSKEKAVHYLRNQDPMFEVMSFLSAQKDVRGVLYAANKSSYFHTGGYYYLHHEVPFYTGHTLAEAQRQRPGASLESLVSHIVTETGPQIDGFEPLQQRGDLVIWQRRDNDQKVARWREPVVKTTSPNLNNLVDITLRQLRASPLFGFWVADLSWEEMPPIKLLDEPASQPATETSSGTAD